MDNLQGKKVAILGMGTNNRHLAEYLKSIGVDFDVFEGWNTPKDLVGKLNDYDVLFRTPGLPYFSEPIQSALQSGIQVSSQTKLFFELCPAKIIGVTGTKGKGTTSSLIASILTKAGKRVWLAGNIGRDPFEYLKQIEPDDFVVMELSSFQLQDLTRSPYIAVMLNITPDHLNHHGSFGEYLDAKTSILKYQNEGDVAVLHPSLPEDFQGLGFGKKYIFDPAVVASWPRKLLGKHNLENIAAAAETAKLLNIPEEIVKSAVASFFPLPHRLENIGEYQGVTYIDDGFSTNVPPTIAAVEAMTQPVILIVGGHDKGLDFFPLGEKIKSVSNVKAVVVIGEVTEKIVASLAGFTGKILTGARDMKEIVYQAQSVAKEGDVILFSPGTSSFDMFKNEQDRAEQFVSVVKGTR